MSKSEDIRELIAEDLEQAIVRIGEILDRSHRLYTLFLALRARFDQNKRDRMNGVVSAAENRVELNQIRYDFFELADQIGRSRPASIEPEIPPAQLREEGKSRVREKTATNPPDLAGSGSPRNRRRPIPRLALPRWGPVVLTMGLLSLGLMWGIPRLISNSSPRTDEIKEVISGYYETIHERDYEKLGTYFAAEVDTYYTLAGTGPEPIVERMKKSKQDYEIDSLIVQWPTLQVEGTEKGYKVSYQAEYTIKKTGQRQQEFLLEMRVHFNSDLRITSMNETILSRR